MCAMVTRNLLTRLRSLSLVIYELPGTFDANIGKIQIKLKLTLSSISCYGWKFNRVRF